MTVFAIDPGTSESAWAIVRNGEFLAGAKTRNQDVEWDAEMICNRASVNVCAVERIASYGMVVGAEVFETAYWSGRFCQVLERLGFFTARPTRKEVVVHLCGSAKAKDANARQAIIDRLGPPKIETWPERFHKKTGEPLPPRKVVVPGPTHGISGDVWAALAVALYTYDMLMEKK